MEKQGTSSALHSGNLTAKYTSKKETFMDQFIVWFRNFLDNAE